MEIWLFKVSPRKAEGGLASVALFYVQADCEATARDAMRAEQAEAVIELVARLDPAEAAHVRREGPWLKRLPSA